MLNFISPHLAINYFLLAFFTILGVLQFVAARHGLIGLSLVGVTRKAAWNYLLAAILIVGAFAWFFASTPEVFRPGLAGSELAIIFGAAGFCALAFTLAVASISQRRQCGEGPNFEVGDRFRHQAVSRQQFEGTLYLPEDTGEARAAVCVLPSLSGAISSHPIEASLVEAGFIVLAIDWGPEKGLRYPGVLGILPGVVAYLAQRDDVDSERIGVLGIGLGGDVAIRSAATDQQIAAVLALAPYLDPANTKPGLGILREMSYLEALRWSSFRERDKLVAELAPLDSMGKLGSRPLLLVYGDQDGIMPIETIRATLAEAIAQGKLKLLPGESHLGLPCSPRVSALITNWFKRNL